jgi:hypothetical protein
MRYLLSLLIIVVALPAWAKCDVANRIETHCTDTSSRSYVILGTVEGKDADLMNVRCLMLEHADKHRADAVLNYDVIMEGEGPSSTSTARGIAIRYTKPGERGTHYIPASKNYKKLP